MGSKTFTRLKIRPEAGRDWPICSKFQVRLTADGAVPPLPSGESTSWKIQVVLPENQDPVLVLTVLCAKSFESGCALQGYLTHPQRPPEDSAPMPTEGSQGVASFKVSEVPL